MNTLYIDIFLFVFIIMYMCAYVCWREREIVYTYLVLMKDNSGTREREL